MKYALKIVNLNNENSDSRFLLICNEKKMQQTKYSLLRFFISSVIMYFLKLDLLFKHDFPFNENNRYKIFIIDNTYFDAEKKLFLGEE